MVSTSFFASAQSQKRWRLHMNYQYSTKNQNIRPCVFQVPDNLRETKPEAYIPQTLGLGPYHHFRPQVQHMSSKKRDAVFHILKEVESSYKGEAAVKNYEYFIRSIKKSSNQLHSKIRSCYDRFLDLDEKTLSWIVVVDCIVLWHIIVTSLERTQVPVPDGSSSDEESVPKAKGISFDYEKIAPDIFMLENQIPAFLIVDTRTVLGLTSDADFRDRFYYFCEEHSPLSLTTDPAEIDAAYDMYNHILHFMYQLIMRRTETVSRPAESATCSIVDLGYTSRFEELTKRCYSKFKVYAGVTSDQAAEIYRHVVDEFSAAMEKAEKAGLKVDGNIQKVFQLLQKVESTFQQHHNKTQVLPGDKIDIPSVSRLVRILGVQFKPLPDGNCNDGISSIKLAKTEDGKALVFYLPVIKLRPNSEAIIRNLVAYEATMCNDELPEGSTRLREFVDLMCGLIKSEKDVQLLKEAGILKMDDSQLQAQHIVNMCSGIRKSDVKPRDDSKVQSTVKDANAHFNKALLVKLSTGLLKFVLFMVKHLTMLFPFLIVVFLCFQSVCEMVDCRVGPRRLAAANLYFDDRQAPMLSRKLLPY